MAIIRRRSPGFFTSSSGHVFVLAICVLLSTEMAAAWTRDMCIPGDVYIDSRSYPAKGTGCGFCETWCSKQCSDLELPAVSYGCFVPGDTDYRCKCCCGRSSSSVSSNSSLPTLLTNVTESEFNGGWPQDYNICQSGEDHVWVERFDGRFCTKNPSCEETCRKRKRWLTRAECVAGGSAFPNPYYKWYEQCCCGVCKPPPPPPPPLPPPQWCTGMSSSESSECCYTTAPKSSPLCPSAFLPAPPKNMCRLEDIHVALNTRDGCGSCSSECKKKCSDIDSSMVIQRCTVEPSSQLCECCCKNNTPSAPRPAPQTPSINTGSATTEDAFIPTLVTDCSLCTNKYCEDKCSESGVIFTRMECTSSKCNCWFRTTPQPLSTNALES